MIKVSVQYSFMRHKEKAEFEFENGTSKEDIENEIETDYNLWMGNYLDGGWYIENQEVTDD